MKLPISMRSVASGALVTSALLLSGVWLMSPWIAFSIADHDAAGQSELGAGFSRGRFIVKYRDGFVMIPAGVSWGFQPENPRKAADVLGEFYFERFRGPIPVYGLAQAAFMSLEIPISMLLLGNVLLLQLLRYRGSITLKMLLSYITAASLLLGWYTSLQPWLERRPTEVSCGPAAVNAVSLGETACLARFRQPTRESRMVGSKLPTGLAASL